MQRSSFQSASIGGAKKSFAVSLGRHPLRCADGSGLNYLDHRLGRRKKPDVFSSRYLSQYLLV